LLVARTTAPPAWFHREEGRLARFKAFGIRVPRERWLEVPVVAFLVEHPLAGPILIDTGLDPAVATDPKAAFGRLGGLIFKDVRMEADQAVAAQLRERGIQPADVAIVVMTHLHSDHAGGIPDFPESTFVVSGKEWDTAASSGQLQGYVARQYERAFDWRTLDFDGPAAESFATFGRSFDLLGDGSLRLVFTPGHTLGHLSAVLRLGDGEAVVAGDAIYTLRTLRRSDPPYRMADEHLFRRSLRELQLYEKETANALVIAGHDMEQWRSLPGVIE